MVVYKVRGPCRNGVPVKVFKKSFLNVACFVLLSFCYLLKINFIVKYSFVNDLLTKQSMEIY